MLADFVAGNVKLSATDYILTAIRSEVRMTRMTVVIEETVGAKTASTTIHITEREDGTFAVNGNEAGDVWREILHHRNQLILQLSKHSTMEFTA